MKTTVITTAFLALLFAGCSKDETKDLAPAGQTSTSEITRFDADLSGSYTVLKYSKGGVDSYDEMKDLKLRLMSDGKSARTIVGTKAILGEYKYDSNTKRLGFNISGNSQSNTLGTHVWEVSKTRDGRLILNSTEDKLSLSLQNVSLPLAPDPVR